jgi:hypothetical protein
MLARRFLTATLAAAVLTIPLTVDAKTKKATAKKPADATGQCDDGTYTRAKTQQGACSSHGGVKTWYGEAAAPSTPTKTTTAAKAPTKAKANPTTTGPIVGGPDSAPPVRPIPSPATTKAAPGAAPKTSADAGTRLPEKPVKVAPAGAPEGATAKCKDGTFSHSKTHTGACSHHGGVAEWYK